jgi:hypothetical protein
MCRLWSKYVSRGPYIQKYPHPGGGGNISRCYLGEKYEKGEEKKGVYVKEKGRKRLGSKRENNCKIGKTRGKKGTIGVKNYIS